MTGANISRKSIASIMTFMIVGYACVLPVENARILAIQFNASKSHWNFMSAILRALTDNGHSVTAFTPIVDGIRENYSEVDISSIFPTKFNTDFEERIKPLTNQFKSLRFVMQYYRSKCDLIYKNEQLDHVLTNNLDNNFDAILIEPGLLSDCMTKVVTRSNLPLIFSVPISSNIFSERETTGHFQTPATLSSIFSDYAFPKTFAQRFTNTIVFLYGKTIVAFEEYLLKTFAPKSYDTNISVPPSLVFINKHFISNKAQQPTASNVISVGGIHLRPPKKIPNDILKFIEDSPHGVILFTFGSTIAMSSIPKNIQNIFKEVLAQLPQRVLLKYEGEMEDKPANVMTKKWFPQRDILMHQNVKLFISHGGISGIYEAVDAGVPVLGFPLFGDQAKNIDSLVEAGMAISMEVFSVSKDSFSKNVVDLINNNKYKRNAKIASEIFKDRPMSLEKSVVYWTEYIIRYKEAPPLKSDAFNLTWYQYILLDVIAVFSICLFIIFRILKMVYNYIIKIKFE